MPVAQAIVLRRVLMGGISTNSGRVVLCLVLVRASDGSGTVGGVRGGLVFGTLLGPEATGPWFFPLRGRGAGLCVSGFLAAPIMHVVCVGCVVRGCCLRTT